MAAHLAGAIQRVIGARIPNFSGHGDVKRFDLRAMPPPIAQAQLRERFLWSFRLTGDPAHRRMRWVVIDTFLGQQCEAEAANLDSGPPRELSGDNPRSFWSAD